VSWTLPNPPLIDRLEADGSSLRELLEDWEMELLALAWRTADEMNVVNPVAGEGWSTAQRDLERVLGTQGCKSTASHVLKRHSAWRLLITVLCLCREKPLTGTCRSQTELSTSKDKRAKRAKRIVSVVRICKTVLFTNLRYSYYASLGALPDFADSLVDYAYERQTQCDVLNEPYYYECIQAIAKQRGSDELQLKTTMLESKGLVSRRDLSEAYKYFDLPVDGGAADDERIYNVFQAQHADLAPQQQERAREMLGRIGRRRGSKLLMNASQQKIETAAEAYAWLGNGLGPETDDSFVVSIFSLRVSQTQLPRQWRIHQRLPDAPARGEGANVSATTANIACIDGWQQGS